MATPTMHQPEKAVSCILGRTMSCYYMHTPGPVICTQLHFGKTTRRETRVENVVKQEKMLRDIFSELTNANKNVHHV